MSEPYRRPKTPCMACGERTHFGNYVTERYWSGLCASCFKKLGTAVQPENRGDGNSEAKKRAIKSNIFETAVHVLAGELGARPEVMLAVCKALRIPKWSPLSRLTTDEVAHLKNALRQSEQGKWGIEREA